MSKHTRNTELWCLTFTFSVCWFRGWWQKLHKQKVRKLVLMCKIKLGEEEDLYKWSVCWSVRRKNAADERGPLTNRSSFLFCSDFCFFLSRASARCTHVTQSLKALDTRSGLPVSLPYPSAAPQSFVEILLKRVLLRPQTSVSDKSR